MIAQARHWLVDLATRGGCPPVDLPAGDSLAPGAIWSAVADAWGISAADLAGRVAEQFHLPVADFAKAAPHALTLLPESLARRYLLFPLRESDRQLVVATWAPANLDAEHAIGFVAGRTPVFEVAPPQEIQRAIDKHYGSDRIVERLLERVGSEVSEIRVVEDTGPEMVAARDLESAPVVKLTSLILADAIHGGASDIHLEPGRDGGQIRFRIDGLLRTYMQIPMPALDRVVSRIKVIGKMDIADRLRPQDGRTRIQLDGRTLDLRLSTVPTRDAEKAVIRLLDPINSRRLSDLSVPLPELTRFQSLLHHRDGIVVVTGPTGSGKTTTLYAALREVATNDVNVMTVEDPVEYELPGMTQIQVEPRRNVTFATALRAILRQDPNIIFIGEIRDGETAEIAVQAALTGHLVLATIHANDAVGAVARFVDLGLEPAKIGGTLRGALAQRLLRRICPACAVKVEGALTPGETRLAAYYGVAPVMRAVGCPACGRTGYKGRIAIMEVMTAGDWLEPLVHARAQEADLQRAAVQGGMRSLRTVALERVANGETTLEEVERVVGSGAVTEHPSGTDTPRILVADDDAVTRALARSVLEQQGFRVTEAADGVAALEQLSAAPDIRLVVLDLGMPRMAGSEVLGRIRHAVPTAGLPVVILTGTTDAATEVALMEQGADDYVLKPLEPALFSARVKAALRRAGG